VTALVRGGSEQHLPPGCQSVIGDALNQATFKDRIKPADTFVQLVGVPHPSPAKATQFRAVDLVSVRESVMAASAAGIQHFIYLSVAQPSPIMRAYVAVRAEGEAVISQSGMNTTLIRPLYVLGPGHWWPYAILPFFWLCSKFPRTRAAALRLHPVTLAQTIRVLVQAVEQPPKGLRIIEAPEIRAAR
jgi:uncharacterized protein YbjT (DUF2867 family)